MNKMNKSNKEKINSEGIKKSLIDKFQIKNYKIFADFEIKNLGRVNIFVGNNNLGKSTFLESIFALSSGKHFEPALKNTFIRNRRIMTGSKRGYYSIGEQLINSFNDSMNNKINFKATFKDETTKEFEYDFELSEILKELNNNLDIGVKSDFELEEGSEIKSISLSKLKIKEDRKNKNILKLDLKFPFQKEEKLEKHYISARYIDEKTYNNPNNLKRIYGYLKRNPTLWKEFNTELSKNFEGVENLELIPYPDGSIDNVSIRLKGGRIIPIYEFGNGMQKWVDIVGNALLNQNSIFCIEEIASTIHPEAQGNLGKNLSSIAKKKNLQIFSTTHSLEFIKNYLSDVEENYLKDIRVITLQKINKKIKARTLNGKDALELITENNMELR